MPRILLIEVFDDQFEKVGFYTIRDEDRENSETDRFIARYYDPDSSTYEPGFEEACELILLWIEEIGKRGLKVIRPRAENDAEALPPKPGTVQKLDLERPPLRLYYVRLSDQVVVLCGGEKKTGKDNQESGTLMTHFRLANAVAEKLTEMMQDGEIWTNDTVLEGDEEEMVIFLKA